MVAQFIGVISRNDAELARLHGMGQQNVAVRAEVDVNVKQTATAILDRATAELLALDAQRQQRLPAAVVDAEVIAREEATTS